MKTITGRPLGLVALGMVMFKCRHPVPEIAKLGVGRDCWMIWYSSVQAVGLDKAWGLAIC